MHHNVNNWYLEANDIPDGYVKYCVLMSNGTFLCPGDFMQMSALRYMNHTKIPNIEFKMGKLHARTVIHPGVELTLYYSDLLTHPKNHLWMTPADI